MKAIDESEGLKPEAVDQMKSELLLVRGKVLATLEKELQEQLQKDDEEDIEKVFAEADEVISQLDSDTERLHGADVETVGCAKKLVANFLFAHLVKCRRWAAVQEMAVDEDALADAGERARPRYLQSNAAL